MYNAVPNLQEDYRRAMESMLNDLKFHAQTTKNVEQMRKLFHTENFPIRELKSTEEVRKALAKNPYLPNNLLRNLKISQLPLRPPSDPLQKLKNEARTTKNVPRMQQLANKNMHFTVRMDLAQNPKATENILRSLYNNSKHQSFFTIPGTFTPREQKRTMSLLIAEHPEAPVNILRGIAEAPENETSESTKKLARKAGNKKRNNSRTFNVIRYRKNANLNLFRKTFPSNITSFKTNKTYNKKTYNNNRTKSQKTGSKSNSINIS